MPTSAPAASSNPIATSTVSTPRVTIEFCTQCKWLLRAAYFAQELLSTFSTSLGEVALIPSTGGVFRVHLEHISANTLQKSLLWDRKSEGGFPETKELKRRVRDIIDPKRDLGHVDGKKSVPASSAGTNTPVTESSSKAGWSEIVPPKDGEQAEVHGQMMENEIVAPRGEKYRLSMLDKIGLSTLSEIKEEKKKEKNTGKDSEEACEDCV